MKCTQERGRFKNYLSWIRHYVYAEGRNGIDLEVFDSWLFIDAVSTTHTYLASSEMQGWFCRINWNRNSCGIKQDILHKMLRKRWRILARVADLRPGLEPCTYRVRVVRFTVLLWGDAWVFVLETIMDSNFLERFMFIHAIFNSNLKIQNSF
jgi:hypothetical protein